MFGLLQGLCKNFARVCNYSCILDKSNLEKNFSTQKEERFCDKKFQTT